MLDFTPHPSDTGLIKTQQTENAMSLKKHPQYTLNDYRYLKAKGWTDKEILARWDSEKAQGKAPAEWKTPLAQEKLQEVLGVSK